MSFSKAVKKLIGSTLFLKQILRNDHATGQFQLKRGLEFQFSVKFLIRSGPSFSSVPNAEKFWTRIKDDTFFKFSSYGTSKWWIAKIFKNTLRNGSFKRMDCSKARESDGLASTQHRKVKSSAVVQTKRNKMNKAFVRSQMYFHSNHLRLFLS